MWHGVNVRAKEQYRQLVGSCTPAKNIPGRIYADLEPRISHQSHRVRAPSEVRLCKSNAAHTALGVFPKFAELLKGRPQTFLFHVTVGRTGRMLILTVWTLLPPHKHEAEKAQAQSR
jgi:hypothetical protein